MEQSRHLSCWSAECIMEDQLKHRRQVWVIRSEFSQRIIACITEGQLNYGDNGITSSTFLQIEQS